jgi:hypothetical protein
VSSRAWIASLAALVALRLAIPLVALAASGHDLPGLPPYTYVPLNGDAHRVLRRVARADFGRLRPGGSRRRAASLCRCLGGVAAAAGLEGSRRRRACRLAGGDRARARLGGHGRRVVGWPLLWAIPLFPLRLLGVLDPDLAFAVGLPILLAANAVTVVATAVIGFRATGRRWVGVAAAALFAVWPLLARLLAGPSAWENGQWHVDVGLHLYTEPLSTALVATAIAVLLGPRLDELRLALAGVLLGYATAVRVSNGLFAAAAVFLVALRVGPRRVLPFALGGLAFVPLVAAYWPKSYPVIENVPGFSLAQASRSWGFDTLMFDPRTVALLLPLAVLGAFALRPWTSVLLISGIATNVVLYTFYEHTHLHPRFLYVTLPALFVLQAAGAGLVIRKVSRVGAHPGL